MAQTTPAMPRNRSKSKTPDQSVKLAGDVVQMARSIVSVRGGAMAELIASICRPVLMKAVKEMQDRGEFLPPPPPPAKPS